MVFLLETQKREKKLLVRNGNNRSERIISGTATWRRPCLTSVDPPVLGQVTGQGEGLPTVLADVRPLAGVRPHVLLQISSRRPSFIANCTHIRPLARVPPHMHIKSGEGCEIFRAMGAAVRPLPRVPPQVALESIAGFEAFAALGAQEATLVGVVRPVRVEAGQRAVRLAALVTFVRTESVCALMDTKLGHPWTAQKDVSERSVIGQDQIRWST